ncbi:MAG: sulfite exporter TauE/SafE family protein [Candidatus Omnitrophica bacterium]|nr:sulfite exporter TauE/SafE family protein [Candidatus Omnitrophota bacterium]
MNNELLALYATAASIGFIHTIFGPDHYLPFIVMSKARKWSLAKTNLITFVCGLGHIMSSVILGIIGVAFGVAVMKLEAFESVRGNLAGWALIAFGFTYFIWGVHSAVKNRPHRHLHLHDGSSKHAHAHAHTEEHAHVHQQAGKKSITPWVLFTIFVLGPCEPLIPILMYPAAKNSIIGLVGVTATFGLVTIGTMLSIVTIASLGVNILPLGRLERYSHALAGAAICVCGLAINFLGL